MTYRPQVEWFPWCRIWALLQLKGERLSSLVETDDRKPPISNAKPAVALASTQAISVSWGFSAQAFPHKLHEHVCQQQHYDIETKGGFVATLNRYKHAPAPRSKRYRTTKALPTCKGHFSGHPVNGKNIIGAVITSFNVKLLRGSVPTKGQSVKVTERVM